MKLKKFIIGVLCILVSFNVWSQDFESPGYIDGFFNNDVPRDVRSELIKKMAIIDAIEIQLETNEALGIEGNDSNVLVLTGAVGSLFLARKGMKLGHKVLNVLMPKFDRILSEMIHESRAIEELRYEVGLDKKRPKVFNLFPRYSTRKMKKDIKRDVEGIVAETADADGKPVQQAAAETADADNKPAQQVAAETADADNKPAQQATTETADADKKPAQQVAEKKKAHSVKPPSEKYQDYFGTGLEENRYKFSPGINHTTQAHLWADLERRGERLITLKRELSDHLGTRKGFLKRSLIKSAKWTRYGGLALGFIGGVALMGFIVWDFFVIFVDGAVDLERVKESAQAEVNYIISEYYLK